MRIAAGNFAKQSKA